tara:strand:+ start:265 stop:486 length:222 start_codon:yes stop_codon:yes gene_type:complete
MSHNVYKGKPEEGKVYALTGGPKAACIANGNTWADSKVKPKYNKLAVDQEIKKDPSITVKEAKLIHRLLKGRK